MPIAVNDSLISSLRFLLQSGEVGGGVRGTSARCLRCYSLITRVPARILFTWGTE